MQNTRRDNTSILLARVLFSLQIARKDACPRWFVEVCKENIWNMKYRKDRDVDRPDHLARQKQIDARLPLKDNWEYYWGIFKDQQTVIES